MRGEGSRSSSRGEKQELRRHQKALSLGCSCGAMGTEKLLGLAKAPV